MWVVSGIWEIGIGDLDMDCSWGEIAAPSAEAWRFNSGMTSSIQIS